MKTYCNEKLGFEIDVPDEWPSPQTLGPDALLFDRAPMERFNFVIGLLLPERLQEYTEFEFRTYIQKQGFTDLDFGRIAVGGKDHVWARYRMRDGTWTKKYMIVFAGIEFAITASCACAVFGMAALTFSLGLSSGILKKSGGRFAAGTYCQGPAKSAA